MYDFILVNYNFFHINLQLYSHNIFYVFIFMVALIVPRIYILEENLKIKILFVVFSMTENFQ